MVEVVVRFCGGAWRHGGGAFLMGFGGAWWLEVRFDGIRWCIVVGGVTVVEVEMEYSGGFMVVGGAFLMGIGGAWWLEVRFDRIRWCMAVV